MVDSPRSTVERIAKISYAEFFAESWMLDGADEPELEEDEEREENGGAALRRVAFEVENEEDEDEDEDEDEEEEEEEQREQRAQERGRASLQVAELQAALEAERRRNQRLVAARQRCLDFALRRAQGKALQGSFARWRSQVAHSQRAQAPLDALASRRFKLRLFASWRSLANAARFEKERSMWQRALQQTVAEVVGRYEAEMAAARGAAAKKATAAAAVANGTSATPAASAR